MSNRVPDKDSMILGLQKKVSELQAHVKSLQEDKAALLPQWEYCAMYGINLCSDENVSQINALGNAGWELVASSSNHTDMAGKVTSVLWFKKRKL